MKLAEGAGIRTDKCLPVLSGSTHQRIDSIVARTLVAAMCVNDPGSCAEPLFFSRPLRHLASSTLDVAAITNSAGCELVAVPESMATLRNARVQSQKAAICDLATGVGKGRDHRLAQGPGGRRRSASPPPSSGPH